MRSVEVGLGRRIFGRFLWHFVVVLMDLEAETLSELTSFMLYRSILVSGADVIKHMEILTEKGSKFYYFF